MKKQLICIILILALLASMTTFTITASETLNLSVSEATAAPGGEVVVTINLSNNPGLASLKFDVAYDECLTLTKVEFNAAFGELVTAAEPFTNPQTLAMISPFENVEENGVFATLTFEVSKSIQDGHIAPITVSYDPDDIFDVDYENVEMETVNGSVTIAEQKVSVKAFGDIAYTVSGNVITVDHKNACKAGYLIDGAYVAIPAVANGDGTYSFTVPAGVTEVILVAKGDANGDANVNIVDKMTVAKSLLPTTHAAYQPLNSVQQFACNTDNVTAVNMVDKLTIAKSLLLPTHPAYQSLKW